MRFAAALLWILAPAAASAQAVTEADVRGVIARQQETRNAGDVTGYFATFAPDALFREEARTGGGKVVPYGTSTRAQAQAQTRRFLAGAKLSETVSVRGVSLQGPGAAQALSQVVGRVTGKTGQRTYCAERRQVFARQGRRLLVTAQTDTLVRCPRAR